MALLKFNTKNAQHGSGTRISKLVVEAEQRLEDFELDYKLHAYSHAID